MAYGGGGVGRGEAIRPGPAPRLVHGGSRCRCNSTVAGTPGELPRVGPTQGQRWRDGAPTSMGVWPMTASATPMYRPTETMSSGRPPRPGLEVVGAIQGGGVGGGGLVCGAIGGEAVRPFKKSCGCATRRGAQTERINQPISELPKKINELQQFCLRWTEHKPWEVDCQWLEGDVR